MESTRRKNADPTEWTFCVQLIVFIVAIEYIIYRFYAVTLQATSSGVTMHLCLPLCTQKSNFISSTLH